MAYWWVSQNRWFRRERAGQYLWAPDSDSAGKTPHHWATVGDVEQGDIVFSFVGQRIVSVAVATTASRSSRRPREFGDPLWEDEGKLVEVRYRDLEAPLVVRSILPELSPLLPEKYSPLTRTGTGNQGYLFGLPPRAGRLLLDKINAAQSEAFLDDLEERATLTAPKTTERRALVQSRIGQGLFRENLIRRWNGRCAVTGLDLVAVLRASHIKPWRDCNNAERLDTYNGLLLSPSYDAAFDAGLITFDDAGGLIVSAQLTPERSARLGLSTSARIPGLADQNRRYLAHHRANVFMTGPLTAVSGS